MTVIQGLSSAEVEKRRAAGLGNNVVRRTGRSTLDIIRSNVFTRVNALLGVLFVIVLATGSIINGAFGLLIICNSAVGIIQELRAKRTLDKLTILSEAPVTVLRDGTKQSIAQEEIVQGDVIEISAGEQLVVDGPVLENSHLYVDESLLTGESDPVQKDEGDEVLSGSFVAAGSGLMTAEKVGSESYSAKLIAEAGRFTLTGSELQDGINKILRVITWILIPVGLLTIYTQIFRSGDGLRDAVLAMVAALVPMIPEGLVLMTSIAFAVGVVRLGRVKALINELPAIEGLARVDTVCADKTGTLTSNTMDFAELIDLRIPDKNPGQGSVEVKSSGSEAPATTILASIAAADEHPNDTMAAIKRKELSDTLWPIADNLPFDSRRKWSLWDFGPHGCYALGAADILLEGEALAQANAIANTGMRVLAIVSTANSALKDHRILQPQPVGLVVLEQHVRKDVPGTLAFFEHEGVDVKIISGDNAASVGAVARTVGIDGEVVDARSLPDPEEYKREFTNTVDKSTVFGRVTPGQKRDMVRALQSRNHIVAMTGDGVNDVLALKDANIGVAMGSGASATRSVAQVVLLDNNFATLPKVVAEGRRVIGNIERVANLFLVKTVYSALLALIIGLTGVVFPFQPIHVTMAGWFAIGIPAFILSLAPNYERARPGFSKRVLRLALPAGITIGIITSGFWLTHYKQGADMQASTATLAVLLIMALWVLCIVARPLNWWRVLLIVVAYSAYIIIFSIPPLAKMLFLDATNLSLLLQAVVTGMIGAFIIEILHRFIKTV
ncbi:MAG: HAD-IC family P-type ATPase [Corynebacterium sp.]|nr:HAD-IC family P-type ATPase [Corynebacterium sp.]